MRRLFAIALVLGMLAWAAPAAASDDCVAAAGARACVLDDHCRPTFQNYRDCVNTLAAASASAGAAGVGASGGVQAGQVERVGCGWPLCGWRDTIGRADAGVSTPAGSAGAQAWVTQSEFLFGDTPRSIQRTTTAGVALHGAGHGASLAYVQLATSAGCRDRVTAASTLTGPAGLLDQACVREVPQLLGTCVATPAGPACGRFPDWPDNTGLPFL